MKLTRCNGQQSAPPDFIWVESTTAACACVSLCILSCFAGQPPNFKPAGLCRNPSFEKSIADGIKPVKWH